MISDLIAFFTQLFLIVVGHFDKIGFVLILMFGLFFWWTNRFLPPDLVATTTSTSYCQSETPNHTL